MVYNYELLTLKFVLINEGESNKKLPKMFAGKNLRMTQKKLPALIESKKGLTRYVKNRCASGR